MIEMLAVVAIIVILLGISIVSVVYYRDLLKITELDNAAREIYMAAENRAVLLSGAKRLSNQLGDGESGAGRPTKLTGYEWHSEEKEELYYVSKAKMTLDLLKTGSIDPALRKDGVDFYVVYDKNSGSVTDVFYAEESMDDLMTDGFEAFYKDWAQSRSKRLEQKNVMLVGWYNGQAAQSKEIGPEEPKKPKIRVIIENGEELTVRVEYEAPAEAKLSVKLGDKALTNTRLLDVALPEGEITVPAGAGSFTWVLDRLEKGDRKFKDEKCQFKDLNSGVTPGDDFTVEATLTPQNGASFEEVSDSDTDNSLFQEGSGLAAEDDGEQTRVCYIEYLRHLQNLSYSSGVPSGENDTKIRAVQTENILDDGNKVYSDYDFIPISNSRVKEYDGREKKIRNLHVDCEDAAGLFDKTDKMLFKNVRMVNATVKSEKQSVGALTGEAYETTIQNCWVYWETDETVTDLKAELGSDADGYNFKTKGIRGKEAGGLVGVAGSGVKIMNCLAATLVSNAEYDDGLKDEYGNPIYTVKHVGGLVGQIDGNVTIRRSYADCYLSGDNINTASKAAGLVGNLNGSVTLNDCYAAGFIVDGAQAAGLCLGGGTTVAANVYSVMRYPGWGSEKKIFFLTENQGKDSFTNTHFLGKESQNVPTKDGIINSTSYADMTNKGPGDKNFAAIMAGQFEWKRGKGSDTINSNPYNLREHLTLDAYSFPGLKDLPHYGDWGAEFKEPSLVYYEEYSDNTWGVSGGNARDLINNLSDTKTILSDGYGVAFLQTDLQGGGNPKLICTYSDYYYVEAEEKWEWSLKEEKIPYEKLIPTTWTNDDGSTAQYYMIPLPDELINSSYAQDCFYRYLKFELELGGEVGPSTGEYFYNPHFAETVVPIVDQGVAGGWTEGKVTDYANGLAGVMDEVKIRTPRHLYDLSQFKEYYTRSSVYHQILDLDYSTYNKIRDLSAGQNPPDPENIEYETEHKEDKASGKVKESRCAKQKPIGRVGEAFAGTYNGDYHVIRNVVPKVNRRQYAGLFGYSGGKLSNIVYEMDPARQVTVSLGGTTRSLYVGALAGGNSGTIENCAVSGANLVTGASGVTLYAGGLVGQNSGTIRGCAAEFAQLSAECYSFPRIYIGGLVGENAGSGSISTSYAVGRIGVKVDTTIQGARTCGFVGWNHGSISDSYAAVDLQSGGEKVEARGFCGEKDGSQSGTGYLDRGNFTYRGASYAAKYHQNDDKAASVTYARLSGNDKENPFTVAGMEKVSKTHQGAGEEMEEKEYPFPSAVKDRAGNYVHYGHWPEPMPLGEMGVFYWEKLVDADDGVSNPTYHMSALAVDPGKGIITKQSTLSEVHDDGRVVTDYGYGYYSSESVTENVTLTAKNIGYTEFVGTSGGDRLRYKPLHQQEKDQEIHTPANFKTNVYVNGGATQAQESAFKTAQEASDERSKRIETAAAAGLKELQPDYVFHCWNSYHEGGRASNHGYLDRVKNATSGLYLFNGTNHSAVDPDGGSFTLEQKGGVQNISVTFGINPQFADSMRVKNWNGFRVIGDASTVPLGTKDPVTEEINSFRVRCGAQLQEINWYDTCFTDVTLGQGGYETVSRFPYLSSGNNSGKYVWLQTHDIDWVAEGNTYQDANGNTQPGVFMSIAQIKVNNGNLKGWFGGSYNGQNYTIKNLNISRNGGYEPNCIGLFGAVQNAELKNMVLFSESGTDTVTVEGRTDTTGTDAWYAGGVLAGLALDSTISNCSVAGYTIRDETARARSVQEGDWNKYYTMGGAIGGLVGMTNKDLTGCTAAATIEIVCNHQNDNRGASAPIRVGGLVGSTTASVTNCYTGGEIVTSVRDENGNIIQQARNASIYAGRLIGGVGMGPFGGEGEDAKATVSNCYSYLTLPDAGDVVQARYNIGGAGCANRAPAGTVTAADDYYYGTDVGTGGGVSVTYRQLAGQEDIEPGQRIYDKLNNKPGYDPNYPEASYGPYYPVTSEIEGLSLGGRYSYAPKSWSGLQGLDYPFPTILTQPQDPSRPKGEPYHVHYGGWLLSGIERANGAKPVELDMFATRTVELEDGTAKVEYRWIYDETLTLSEGVAAGGTWSAEVSDKSVVTADFDPNIDGKLIIKAMKANDIPVTVRVKYTIKETVDGEERIKEEYSLPITVYVTDNLELRPSEVKMFPNDVVNVLLSVIGKDPADPNAGDEVRPVLPADGLTVIADGVKSLNEFLAAKLAEPAEPAEGPSHTIELRSDGKFAGEAQVSVTYDYTYTYPEGSTPPEPPYPEGSAPPEPPVSGKTDQIKVNLLTLPESGWSRSEDGTTDVWTMDFSAYKPENFTAAIAGDAPAGFAAEGKDWIVTLTKPADAEFPEGGVSLTVNLTLEGLDHTLTVAVPKPETTEPAAKEKLRSLPSRRTGSWLTGRTRSPAWKLSPRSWLFRRSRSSRPRL